MKRSSDELALDEELKQLLINDISSTIPKDIAMLKRIKSKFPSLQNQVEECERLCHDIILESKNSYKKLKEQE